MGQRRGSPDGSARRGFSSAEAEHFRSDEAASAPPRIDYLRRRRRLDQSLNREVRRTQSGDDGFDPSVVLNDPVYEPMLDPSAFVVVVAYGPGDRLTTVVSDPVELVLARHDRMPNHDREDTSGH